MKQIQIRYPISMKALVTIVYCIVVSVIIFDLYSPPHAGNKPWDTSPKSPHDELSRI